MTNAQTEALAIADRHADENHTRAHMFLNDLRTAESALSTIGAAAGYIDAVAECTRWRAIAETIRAVAS